MKNFSFKLVGQSLKAAGKGFSEDKLTKLSASLAYYTVFSLGPLLIVIIYLCGIFLGQEAAAGEVYDQMKNFVGAESAAQVQDIIKNASLSGKGGLAATIGIITLLIGATTVFGELQDSMNGIWGLKARPKAGIMKLVKDRILSFGLIASLGFILLVSLGATAVVEGIGKRLEAMFPDVTVYIFYVVNLVLNLGVTTVLFAVIFKVLPDAKIRWKNIWPGAIATSLLFLIGKFAISFYIAKSDIGSTYGAAGSLVILLVWVYYSAIILYFGAEFTKAYALKRGAKIIPDRYAEWKTEPVVAGAQPKSPANQPGRARNKVPHMPMPNMLAISHEPRKGKKVEGGIGSALLAIAMRYMKEK